MLQFVTVSSELRIKREPRHIARIVKDAKVGKEVKQYWNMRGRERILSHKESYVHYQDVMHGSSTCAKKSTLKDIFNTAKA